MARYVDGFVIPIPKKKVAAYFRTAAKAAKIWKEHGALEYVECVGDDLNIEMVMPFPKGIKAKAGETVVFSYITYKSRAHRDKVNAKVMEDPRLHKMCTPENTPFDCKRMLYGGFKAVVSA
ncbi:MAG: DUF1428 domain-containing protein [Rariglobus sp.]